MTEKMKDWKNQFSKKERLINVFFSLGASVVILGAMFKLLHLPGAEVMLLIGMTTEAIIFAISASEKPAKSYEWDKVFDFKTGKAVDPSMMQAGTGGVSAGQQTSTESVQMGGVAGTGITGEDASVLSKSIHNLSKTTELIGEFKDATTATNKLTHNLESAAELTTKYLNTQESLIMAANKLQTTYQMIDAGMEGVDKNTKIYATKISDIHQTLGSINDIYGVHLKNIQTQTEEWNKQAVAFRDVTEDLKDVASGMSRIKQVSVDALEETEKFKNSAKDLSAKIEELNKVYGNMLNSLN